MSSFADLKYLSVPLPEDILHAREYGDFDLALRLIDRRIAGGKLPQALVRRLELEKDFLRIIPEEYPYTEREALEILRDGVGEVSDEAFCEMILNRDLDWIYRGGVRYIKDDAISNFYKTHDDMAQKAYERGKRSRPGGPAPLLDAAIAEMKAKGTVRARFRVRSEMTIRPGETPLPVRVWLPIACEYAQASNVRVTACSHPDTAHVDSPQAPQRTICLDGRDDQGFWVEYEFDATYRYHDPDPALVMESQPTFYTEEQAPHILFTPILRSLCREIVGNETNPLTKARLIYDYIVHHIRYAYMRAYYTLPMITEYAAVNQRGDCGVQALLFITLCRIAGIPARWQSGLCVEPGDEGCHDWAQFYVAPFGWLFADCSYGGGAVRRGLKERETFYFGNIDPFRVPANAEFQHDFEIPPRFMRYDPYDNQLGEAEYEDGPVPRGRRSMEHRVISVSGLDCCKERPVKV